MLLFQSRSRFTLSSFECFSFFSGRGCVSNFMQKLNRFIPKLFWNCPWHERRREWVIMFQNLLISLLGYLKLKATVLIDLFCALIVHCTSYHFNLFICWICYHSNCFHSSRSKKWSNILNNGLSFCGRDFHMTLVNELSAELKNDVKRQKTGIKNSCHPSTLQ